MVWYSIVWCSMVWYSIVWYSIVWYSLVWYSIVWYSIVWYSMVWYSMGWCSMMWCSMVIFNGVIFNGVIFNSVIFNPQISIGNYGMSEVQERSQMAMWAMMASPMIMSNDLRSLRASSRDILLNRNVIAISQDPLGKQASMFLQVRAAQSKGVTTILGQRQNFAPSPNLIDIEIYLLNRAYIG